MASRPHLALACLIVLLAEAGTVGTLLGTELSADGGRYRAMTRSLIAEGEFLASYMPMEYPQPNEVENGFTHYFSPLWPVLMAPFYLAFGEAGFDYALLLAVGFALAAAFLTTRNLYGDEVALLVTAGAAFFLVKSATQRGTEPLAFGFYVLMIWAILQSIRPDGQRWIVLAGAMAGLAYLTRSSVGWLFIIGGAAGAFWRIWFHRRGAFNRHYVLAILLFGSAWTLWALRNLNHFWDGTLGGLPHALASDAVFEWKLHRALEEPLRLLYLIPLKLLLGLAFLSPFLALRWRSIAWQLRQFRTEAGSGLVLSWAVPLAMSSVISAIFTIADYAPAAPFFNVDNVRYVVFALPGLLWGPWRLSAPQATDSTASATVPAP